MEPADASQTTPFLSVVMPVHEGAEWIALTLQSLAAEVCDDLEIIVIDSSSTGSTETIIKQFAQQLPITYLRRTDILPWQSKTNLGVREASAEHVCILHQDDLWLPGRVTTVRRWIASAPEAVLHLAPSVFIDGNGRRVGMWTCPLPAERGLEPDVLLERLLVQNFVSVPAPVFLREAWLRCGGMDDTLWYTPDWDVWAKLAAVGPTIYHRETTTAFRIHGSSLTVTGSKDSADFAAQMETVLDRHLPALPPAARRRVEPAARTSIQINALLAAASSTKLAKLRALLVNVAALGPLGARRYLRDSRIGQRVVSRIRAGLS